MMPLGRNGLSIKYCFPKVSQKFPDCLTFVVLGWVVTCDAYMRGRTGDPFTNMV